MGLPYYQVDADFLASTSKLLARRLKRSRHETIGRVCDLIQFVVDRTSTEEKPPDGVFLGPDSTMEIEAGAEWDGPEGELVGGLLSVGMIERLELGLRFRGTDRYREYWEKKIRDRNRKRELKSRGSRAEVARNPHGFADDSTRREEKRREEKEKKEDSGAPPPPKPIRQAPTLKTPQAIDVPKPTTPREQWGSTEFQSWVQYRRQKTGYVPEDPVPIHMAEEWWGAVMQWTGGQVQPACEAFTAFGKDAWWESQAPPYPFRGFMSQWKKYMPIREVRNASGGR